VDECYWEASRRPSTYAQFIIFQHITKSLTPLKWYSASCWFAIQGCRKTEKRCDNQMTMCSIAIQGCQKTEKRHDNQMVSCRFTIQRRRKTAECHGNQTTFHCLSAVGSLKREYSAQHPHLGEIPSCLWFESEGHNVGSNPQARFSKLMKSNISMSHGHELNLCASK
jgi:hypothetical protein